MTDKLNLTSNDFKKSRDIFDKEKGKLQKILSKFDTIIEHIGSTAIKETIGKGIIDIIVACDNKFQQEKIKDVLISNSYRQGELNKKPDGRLFFCNTKEKTQAGDIHLHLVIKNSTNYQEVINFRNYLHKHPKEVEWYNDKKQHISNITNNSRTKYTAHKEPYIIKLINKIKKNS